MNNQIKKKTEKKNLEKTVTDDESDFPFACDTEGCKRRFKCFTGLGGHKSKAHPNTSSAYKAKQQKRQERETDRALLKIAKEMFMEMYPGKSLAANRNKVTQLKNSLKNESAN